VIPLWPVVVLVLGVEASASVADPAAASAPAPAIDLTPKKPPPLQVYNVNLAIDAPIIVVSATVGLLRPYMASQLVRKRCPCDPSGLNALDRSSVGYHSRGAALASDITVVVVQAGTPLLELLDLGLSRALLEDLTVLTETVMVEVVLHQAANFGLQRPRPSTYAGDPASVNASEGYLSFYAGHVGATFAMLSAASYTLRLRYGEQVWPWVVTGLVGTSVAIERVAAGKHFPTDVGVGALVGLAAGIGVPWLHARTTALQVSVIPGPGDIGLGLAGEF
jgi:membrane-associated phospholipid phosphatase